MSKRGRSTIHPAVRECLGYRNSETEAEIFADWKERTSRVCKPCWELKYCPYGPLVEQSPLLPTTRSEHEKSLDYYRSCLENNTIGEHGSLSDEFRLHYEEWLKDEQIIYDQAERQWSIAKQRQLANQSGESYFDEIFQPLPSIEKYRIPFNLGLDSHAKEENHSREDWINIENIAKSLKKKYRDALRTDQFDDRTAMDDERRRMFSAYLVDDGKQYPDQIDRVFTEAACNIFGHICPVFFTAEIMTETGETRRIGRRQLSFSTMMRIVRRDDYRCQHFMKKLRDDEVEFDHVIPVSKGGSSEEYNMRLTCYDCNRDKSDQYIP
jgi:hypothetical protein